MKKETKSLDLQDPVVIRDAVRLLKSQFVELYEKMGYDKLILGNAWHSIRTSSAGNKLLCEVYNGAKHLQAATFIGDMDEEIAIRKDKKKKGK